MNVLNLQTYLADVQKAYNAAKASGVPYLKGRNYYDKQAKSFVAAKTKRATQKHYDPLADLQQQLNLHQEGQQMTKQTKEPHATAQAVANKVDDQQPTTGTLKPVVQEAVNEREAQLAHMLQASERENARLADQIEEMEGAILDLKGQIASYKAEIEEVEAHYTKKIDEAQAMILGERIVPESSNLDKALSLLLGAMAKGLFFGSDVSAYLYIYEKLRAIQEGDFSVVAFEQKGGLLDAIEVAVVNPEAILEAARASVDEDEDEDEGEDEEDESEDDEDDEDDEDESEDDEDESEEDEIEIQPKKKRKK